MPFLQILASRVMDCNSLIPITTEHTGIQTWNNLLRLQVLQQASEKVFVPLTVGGGIREFTDADGKHYSALDVAAEYFRSGADKVSIGGDAVFAAEEFYATGTKSGKSSIEQISWVRLPLRVLQLLWLSADQSVLEQQ